LVEFPFLPEIVALAAVVAVMMLIAYRSENRWSLSLRAANLVGVGIVFLLVAWAAYHVIRPQGTLLDFLPVQAALLVYLGPLVMILIPAKLFRPKHMGDYWGMQLIGLMTVALACALGGNSALLVVAGIYAIAAVWCLINFHAVIHSGDVAVESPVDSLPWRWSRVTLWSLMAMSAAIALSLATPRNSDAQWGVGGLVPRRTIGNDPDRPQIDLNFAGELETSNEVAFVVRAEAADGSPKFDLSPATKWRGSSFNFYDQGKWVNRGWPRQSGERFPSDRRLGRPETGRIPPIRDLYRPREATGLPDLGPNRYFLIFPNPQRGRSSYYLAEPIWPRSAWAGRPLMAPAVTETDGGHRYEWRALPDGELFPPPTIPGVWSRAFYRQVTAPTNDPGLSMAVQIDPALRELLKVLIGLKPLREYSNALVQQLSESGRIANLPNWTPAAGPPPVERHEDIARALETFFSSSGRFEYNAQTLRRVDLTIDPIEDFLLNVRQGHCNRFATALTLVLRAQGIPARIVLGFEGCESNGDGTYTVRQMHAHSWVECLIQRPSADGAPTWHWLTLDPSPSIERTMVAENRFMKWLGASVLNLGEFFRNFVMELNAERQDRARSALGFLSPLEWGPRFLSFMASPPGWILTSSLAVLAGWRRWRRKPRFHTISSVLARLRSEMAAAKMLPAHPGLTPQDIRDIAGQQLTDAKARTAAFSIIDHHREAVYGGQSIDAAALAHMQSCLRTVSDFCRREPRRPPQSTTI
jgi:transglutaminase-like putative cysteine protease